VRLRLLVLSLSYPESASSTELPDTVRAQEPAEVIAAVDLGSNSFHMVVARVDHGQLVIIDRLREMVRLASGLSANGRLNEESQQRALAALRKFGQRLREMRADQVRVVGTNTLRRARNAAGFLAAVEEALGHPVEVISGIEEARLIYTGVSHSCSAIEGRTLVLDIGGGSTELIIGSGYEPEHLESLFIGCVGLSRRFFEDGKLSEKRFQRARLTARMELRAIAARFREIGWQRAVGSSGTVRATAEIASGLGASDGVLTPESVAQIMAQMAKARRLENLKLPALSPERAPVLPGGIAILIETMTELDVPSLEISDGALREGLLFDMLGRMRHEDVRERTVRAIQARYHVDLAQAQRVEQTAAALLVQVAQAWSLTEPSHAQLLAWAARLHEVGLDIAHAKYHQHGGYLLANADLPGFARLDQQLVAKLVASHRRKLDGLDFSDLPAIWRVPVARLIVLLRLAVLLNRSRSTTELPPIGLIARERRLEILLPAEWLADNPLTEADLEQERSWLESAGYELGIAESPAAQLASAS
jgi:exopolyphosphatase / guanosine-5'-triphosphate,3'-diphosphate pyrophosphatase